MKPDAKTSSAYTNILRIAQLKDAIVTALAILEQEDLPNMADSPAERAYCVLAAALREEQ